MTYIKNQILQNNAIEAWAMAIRYCDYILEGKATLEYRKHFVSVLHNSVELFIKQLMLNNTDYRVIQLKNVCKGGTSMPHIWVWCLGKIRAAITSTGFPLQRRGTVI